MSHSPAALSSVPVRDSERIGAIDATRGLALLGIFMVNIMLFSQPFGRFVELTPGDIPPGDKAVHYFVEIFCEGKFYPLFSTLFGVGMAIQMQRARAARRRFWPLGLRRLAVLAVIGLAHAFLLWYGDILFIYSVMGLLLLALGRCTPRVLAIIAAALMGMGILLSTGFTLLTAAAPEQSAAANTEGPPSPPAAPATAPGTAASSPVGAMPEGTGPFMRLMKTLRTQDLTHDAQGRQIAPMSHPIWLETETEAYRRGPYLDAVLFRAMSYGIILIVTFLGFGWTIAAMFLFGAAMTKWNAFAPERLHWHKRFAAVGLGVGLPLAVFAAVAPELLGQSTGAILFYAPIMAVSSPLVALGYLGVVRLLVARGAAPGLFGALAAAGRMALTCYLLETILATLVFYHYGLGQFGLLSRPQAVGVVLAIYAAIVAFSVVWQKRFRFGPMEWLWRSLTYLTPQPMLRRPER